MPPQPLPSPQLLSSLGCLARGLSALFWGLPIALVVCVQTAKGDWFREFGIAPPLITTTLLFYGLILLGRFQQQERVWRAALDRAKILGLLNIGLSPFLYWWSKVPSNPFFLAIVSLFIFSGLLFLFLLNPVLHRLSAMLPDETMRAETRLFTSLNRYLLLATFLFLTLHLALDRIQNLPRFFLYWHDALQDNGLWPALFLVLLPLAMTMALIWKIKEVILASVFGSEP